MGSETPQFWGEEEAGCLQPLTDETLTSLMFNPWP